MSIRNRIAVVALCLVSAGLVHAQDEVRRGRDLFRAKCMNCHSVGCNRFGPKLENVVGRAAGTVPDFKGYSDALRSSGIVWDEKALDAFLRDPSRLVPGNAMAGSVQPIANDRDRRDLVAFMRRQDRSFEVCP